ncbi:MAG: glycine C-acetyltransferase [Blastocatellia bacterium]|nr:glycine C-acetyltransferase [Blastocatellia bacterium]MCS7156282.1 glycine C-acetyltransferase [Blastocatellia bacterium]MCX7751368.1 glycine C-acetyltransferase [Blastocatellia bacterium]MDW8169080.1 glycine C-acetyltransferase [Acidobacteriota bacterium]MDW8255785.1 glycine C-acetyltransferase [Acidobacteriota bacterium]
MATIRELYALIAREIEQIKMSKTYKFEVPIESEQDGVVRVDGREVVMLASNNYLGLSNHPKVKEAALRGLCEYGYGLASVRFICGTQKIHLELEQKIAEFVGCEDAVLHSSCFAANEAFFAGLLANDFGLTDYRDVIYSDQLNHASIIDGIRLCRIITRTTEAKVYAHRNVAQLREMLEADEKAGYRIKIIATDGVFSMEGDLAPLPELIALARQHNALLFVDDSHATGVLGPRGRGTAEELGVFGQVDVITGTFGKALGGACGGFIAGKRELIELLRQKSRPYTFSNTMPPAVVMGSIEALNLLMTDTSLVERLHENTAYFRREIKNLGYTILEGTHPIVPIMLGEAALAMDMSVELLKEGVYIKGLWYPVVPKGEARLRAQISAAHTREHLDRALEAFQKVGRRFGVIP